MAQNRVVLGDCQRFPGGDTQLPKCQVLQRTIDRAMRVRDVQERRTGRGMAVDRVEELETLPHAPPRTAGGVQASR